MSISNKILNTTEDNIKSFYRNVVELERLKHRMNMLARHKEDIRNDIDTSNISLNSDIRGIDYSKNRVQTSNMSSIQETEIEMAFSRLEKQLGNIEVELLDVKLSIRGGICMDSFIAWVGGKKLLRNAIVDRFTTDFDQYVEVFGGGGWVLFHKERHASVEVYNDINGELVNLFKCVKYHPEAIEKELDFVLNARETFDFYKKQSAARPFHKLFCT